MDGALKAMNNYHPFNNRGMSEPSAAVTVCRMDAAYERTWMPYLYFSGPRVTVADGSFMPDYGQ